MDHPILHTPWAYSVPPFAIAERVYYVGSRWVGSFLLDSGAGFILIDCGMPQTLYLLLESIRTLGFDPRDVRLILISHAHFDHAGAAEALRRYTGAKLYMGRQDRCLVGEPLLSLGNEYTAPPFEADGYYEPDTPVTLGCFSILPVHTPGHTPGTHSFFFEAEADGRRVLCGMHGGLGFNTLSAQYLTEAGLPLSLREDFLRGLEKLRSVPVELAIGSHPKVVRMLEKNETRVPGKNPFVDAHTWPDLMEDRIQAFRQFMAEQ